MLTSIYDRSHVKTEVHLDDFIWYFYLVLRKAEYLLLVSDDGCIDGITSMRLMCNRHEVK